MLYLEQYGREQLVHSWFNLLHGQRLLKQVLVEVQAQQGFSAAASVFSDSDSNSVSASSIFSACNVRVRDVDKY